MDGTKALATKGPEGPGMTVKPDTIIAGMDQVAVDSYTLGLSTWNGKAYKPGDVKHISSAHALQIGEMNLDKLNIKKLEV